jgi:hypothetical protein
MCALLSIVLYQHCPPPAQVVRSPVVEEPAVYLHQMVVLSTTFTEGEGGSGEFSLRVVGFGAKTFSIFVLTPKLLDGMCLGVVDSTKFCMVVGSDCAIGSDSKKVGMCADNVDINAGENQHLVTPTSLQFT